MVPRGSKAADDIQWQTNDKLESIASPDAVKGGTLVDSISFFPMTLRQVGPDSNNGFRGHLDNIEMELVVNHPNTDEYIPQLGHSLGFRQKMARPFTTNSNPKAMV